MATRTLTGLLKDLDISDDDRKVVASLLGEDLDTHLCVQLTMTMWAARQNKGHRSPSATRDVLQLHFPAADSGLLTRCSDILAGLNWKH